MSTLSAPLGRAPGRASVELLRWLSGWALVSWLGRLVGRASGLQRRAEVRLEGSAVHVARRSTFWGRVVRDTQEVYALDKIVGVRRHARYPLLPLVVGAVAFGLGVLAGAVLFIDALRTGLAVLLVGAGIAVSLGAVLDLVLRTLIPGRRGRIALELDFGDGAPLRLLGVEVAAADDFVAEVARRLEAR